MKLGRMLGWQLAAGAVVLGALAAGSLTSGLKAAPVAVPDEVTYTSRRQAPRAPPHQRRAATRAYVQAS